MIHSLHKYNRLDIRINIDDEYCVSINKCCIDSRIEQLNKDLINVVTIHFDIDNIKIREYCAQYSEITSTYEKFYYLWKPLHKN
jgi:hypothetical protein